jgi:hypothetical protein
MTNTSFGSRLVHGFRHDNTNVSVSIIIDARAGDAYTKASEIAGPDYCFHMSSNLSQPVPDDAKNILFHSDEELYAKAPALRSRR